MEGKVIDLGDSNKIVQLMNKMHMESMTNNQAPVLAPTVTDTELLNNSVEPGDDIDNIYSDNTPISLKNPPPISLKNLDLPSISLENLNPPPISLENLPHTSGDPTATITVAAPIPSFCLIVLRLPSNPGLSKAHKRRRWY